MQKKFISYRKQLFSLIVNCQYIFVHKISEALITQKQKNAHQRGSVLKDDI